MPSLYISTYIHMCVYIYVFFFSRPKCVSYVHAAAPRHTTAHGGTYTPNTQALSVEWHHTMRWRLATSSEKTVKIWDLEPPVDRQQPSMMNVMEQTLQSTITLGSPGVVSCT